MAVITENRTEDQQFGNGRPSDVKEMQNLVDLLSKLNPLAEEFVPSSYVAHRQSNGGGGGGLSADAPVFTSFAVSNAGFNDNEKPHRRRKNNHNEGKRRLNGRSFRAQREDSIRRTIYVSDIDQTVTEQQLAMLFIRCGQVVDCRICGDPHSHLRFAFVEFADQQGARAALNLSGTMLGFHPLKVLPSKTAILPVNPTFLPKVSRLRLLGDHVHSTRIAFVEFLSNGVSPSVFGIPSETHYNKVCGASLNPADSALRALNISGKLLGNEQIRVSPSKTPVRVRGPLEMLN
ncbi:hypothetical protein QJS04_geneDACA019260 [Acorus gramineus]|uniref:RRM domain-containing protein n=1 Tax=Acorus gramineus TaxID=55184 RepID=A0AAV9A3D1_ACOGR|nr:hypothetical protein QJS04_geneDACA019260 [Acorus gramineus]